MYPKPYVAMSKVSGVPETQRDEEQRGFDLL